MADNRIYDPTTFEPVYKLSKERRSALMKMRNWLWVIDDNWTLHVFQDTDPTRRFVYGKGWVINKINTIFDKGIYEEDDKPILNALRAEYIYECRSTN
jgi:hypothetical protein